MFTSLSVINSQIKYAPFETLEFRNDFIKRIRDERKKSKIDYSKPEKYYDNYYRNTNTNLLPNGQNARTLAEFKTAWIPLGYNVTTQYQDKYGDFKKRYHKLVK